MVNIFGGIMRCDVIAEGIINATSQLNLRVPVVVRLAGSCKFVLFSAPFSFRQFLPVGTRVEEAKILIAKSKLDILSSEDLDDAAQRAVECAKMVKVARGLGLFVTFKEIKTELEFDQPNVTPNLH